MHGVSGGKSKITGMLGVGFKADKCKTALKMATARLRLLKNRKSLQVAQLRRDLAGLLQAGQDQAAFIRVEHVIREEQMMTAFELIEVYCEIIAQRLPVLETQKYCPIDLKEAIGSVIFASPRCGDVTELMEIQKQFTSKYGKDFVTSAVELRPDCGVSKLIVEKLSAKTPDLQKKVKTLTSIAQEHKIEWDAKVFEEKMQPQIDHFATSMAFEEKMQKPSHQTGSSVPFSGITMISMEPPASYDYEPHPVSAAVKGPSLQVEGAYLLAKATVPSVAPPVGASANPLTSGVRTHEEEIRAFNESHLSTSSSKFTADLKDTPHTGTESVEANSVVASAAVELPRRGSSSGLRHSGKSSDPGGFDVPKLMKNDRQVMATQVDEVVTSVVTHSVVQNYPAESHLVELDAADDLDDLEDESFETETPHGLDTRVSSVHVGDPTGNPPLATFDRSDSETDEPDVFQNFSDRNEVKSPSFQLVDSPYSRTDSAVKNRMPDKPATTEGQSSLVQESDNSVPTYDSDSIDSDDADIDEVVVSSEGNYKLEESDGPHRSTSSLTFVASDGYEKYGSKAEVQSHFSDFAVIKGSTSLTTRSSSRDKEPDLPSSDYSDQAEQGFTFGRITPGLRNRAQQRPTVLKKPEEPEVPVRPSTEDDSYRKATSRTYADEVTSRRTREAGDVRKLSEPKLRITAEYPDQDDAKGDSLEAHEVRGVSRRTRTAAPGTKAALPSADEPKNAAREMKPAVEEVKSSRRIVSPSFEVEERLNSAILLSTPLAIDSKEAVSSIPAKQQPVANPVCGELSVSADPDLGGSIKSENDGNPSTPNTSAKAPRIHPKLPDSENFAAYFQSLHANRQ